MIKVTKDFLAIPAQLSANSTLQQTEAAIAAQDGNLYKGHYKHDSVKVALNAIYHKKCAYCESKITQGAPLQVEHFRPKAEVDPIDLLPHESHQGYYWLGNEWSNLLWSCQNCNQQGAKGNRFPIKGVRVLVHPGDVSHHFALHPTLQDEVPLLINPELVDPANHLSLDKNGVIIGTSEFGTTSIDIYKLNRDELIISRLKIINEIVKDINHQLQERFDPSLAHPLNEIQFQRQMSHIFEKIIAGQMPQTAYSFVYISIVLYFETIILAHIEPAFQRIVKQAFQNFLQSILS
jgi:uncharacterized protein (TIGR02646 family)